MQWEELTAPDFEDAVKHTGVCILAMGCLEKHFDHLPLGTDYLNGHKLACMAAEIEPAVVFPHYFFGQINEARCFPGTISLKPELTLELLKNLCDEISRNGFKKIIIYNAHGGNTSMLHFFSMAALAKRQDYVLYLPDLHCLHPQSRREQWKALLETEKHGHACECETSVSLANHEHLVKMENIRDRKAMALNRLKHIPSGCVTGSWYADYPDHYAGDARSATREKGEKLRQLKVESLAEYIAAVKRDTTGAVLLEEFYDRCDQIGK